MNIKKVKDFFLEEWLLLAAIAFLLLRLPSLFEPFTYGDEGIYLTLGQGIKKGLSLYRDIHDNKPPFIYLLAGLADNFFHFRLILFFWAGATMFAFYRLAKIVFGQVKIAVIASTLSFLVFFNLPLFEGNIANAENFWLLPSILGFSLVLKNTKITSFFWAGLFFSLATLFKIPAGFDLLATIAYLSIRLSKNIKKIVYLLAGFIGPIILTSLYFLSNNAFSQFSKAAFWQNIPYLFSWGNGNTESSLPIAMLAKGTIVLIVWITIAKIKNKIPEAIKIILLWFFLALFAALLSNRPYPHYLLQTVPPFCLSFGYFFLNTKKHFIPIFLILTLFFTFFGFKFWHYPTIAYYQNFYQYILKAKTKESFYRHFSKQTKEIYSVSSYLKTHTLKDEKVFIWADQPVIYALSDRLPVGRYTVAYHVIDFHAQKETIDALKLQPPRYLIVEKAFSDFPELEVFLKTNYFLEEQIGTFLIFHRVSLPLYVKISQL